MRFSDLEEDGQEEYIESLTSSANEADDQEESNDSEDLLEELSDVELRLEEANCYKALLQNPLFRDGNQIARKVESKIRDFIKLQLRILIGLDSPKAQLISNESNVFSKDEVTALKEIAGRLIERHKGPPKVEQAVVAAPVNVPQVNMSTVNVGDKLKKKVKVKKEKKPESIEEFIEKDIQFPDGKIRKVKIKKDNQVIEHTAPKMSPQQIADIAAAQAQVQAARVQPGSGILGLAVQAAQNDLIKPSQGE